MVFGVDFFDDTFEEAFGIEDEGFTQCTHADFAVVLSLKGTINCVSRPMHQGLPLLPIDLLICQNMCHKSLENRYKITTIFDICKSSFNILLTIDNKNTFFLVYSKYL